MGAQLGKQRVKPAERKSKSVRMRLQKLRKNRTAPLFTTTSTVSLDKCDSMVDFQGYQSKFSSYLDLYQTASLEVDERPEDLIRAYKDLKNKVHACSSGKLEWRALKQELEVFVNGLDECDVWELRNMLREKAHRLGVILDEKRPTGDHEVYKKRQFSEKREVGETDEVDARNQERGGDEDNCIPGGSIRQVQTFETFLGVSSRLDAVRFRMIEYYGDDKQSEYHEILKELQEIMLEVRAIKDGGVLHVIVTREEYEDYIEVLQRRFERLVQISMLHAKTASLSGGTARIGRIRRSNTNISVAVN